MTVAPAIYQLTGTHDLFTCLLDTVSGYWDVACKLFPTEATEKTNSMKSFNLLTSGYSRLSLLLSFEPLIENMKLLFFFFILILYHCKSNIF